MNLASRLSLLMLFATIWAFSFTASAFQPIGSQEPLDCRALEFLPRPVNPFTDLRDGYFNVYYLLLQGTDSSKPTLIYFPGGPGESVTPRASGIREALGVDESFSLLLVDARGTGCNQFANTSKGSDFYLTKNSASDVVAIVRHLGLDSAAIIGFSYGTALGTIAASELEAVGIKPKFVLLDGILGLTSFDDEHRYGNGFIHNWSRVLQSLPISIQWEFKTQPRPFGISEQNWGRYIVAWLGVTSPTTLIETLSTVTLNRNSTSFAEFKTEVEEGAKAQAVTNELLHSPAFITMMSTGCREFFRGLGIRESTLQAGNLALPTSSALNCGSIPTDQPYDPSRWPVSAPIIYFQGDGDSVTSLESAGYHFYHHARAPKIFIHVADGGHGLWQSPLFTDCRANLLQAASDQNWDSFNSALQTCKGYLNFEISTERLRQF